MDILHIYIKSKKCYNSVIENEREKERTLKINS